MADLDVLHDKFHISSSVQSLKEKEVSRYKTV